MSAHRPPPPGEPSEGRRFEQTFFGPRATFDPVFLETLKAQAAKHRGNFGFMTHASEVGLRNQDRVGWKPACPEAHTFDPEKPEEFTGPIGLIFFWAVYRLLTPAEQSQLRFYCAIGSRLDFFDGIDGYFMLLAHRDNPDFWYCLDLSTDPTVTESREVIDQLINPQDSVSGYVDYFNVLAEGVVNVLRNGHRDGR